MSFVCHLYVPYVTHMSFACHSYVLIFHTYVTRMCSFFIRMSLVCNCMSSYVLVCHSYVTRISVVFTCMSPVCHSYTLVCHPYVTRIYSYATRMSLVYTRMPSVCHSYVVLPWVLTFNDTLRDKAPSIKTPAITKSLNMGIWVT